jgi:AAA+ ATPase superfamily predicted ATPase
MLYVDNMLSSIRESFDQHMAFVYEDVCREFCLDRLKSGVMSFSAIGGWWMKNEEIDLVALDEENGAIWFAECKWSGKAVGEDVYRNLQRKARLVVWRPKDRRERFVLFSKSGFTDGMRKLAGQDDVLLVE